MLDVYAVLLLGAAVVLGALSWLVLRLFKLLTRLTRRKAHKE